MESATISQSLCLSLTSAHLLRNYTYTFTHTHARTHTRLWHEIYSSCLADKINAFRYITSKWTPTPDRTHDILITFMENNNNNDDDNFNVCSFELLLNFARMCLFTESSVSVRPSHACHERSTNRRKVRGSEREPKRRTFDWRTDIPMAHIHTHTYVRETRKKKVREKN